MAVVSGRKPVTYVEPRGRKPNIRVSAELDDTHFHFSSVW